LIGVNVIFKIIIIGNLEKKIFVLAEILSVSQRNWPENVLNQEEMFKTIGNVFG
jgi:hypothetical protein